MNHWFVQWTKKEVGEFEHHDNFMMDCIGHNASNWKKNARRGDIVWIHYVDAPNQNHYLLGKMKLDILLNRDETMEAIGRDLSTVKYEEYWLNLWDWEEMKKLEMGELAGKLNFFPLNRLPDNYMSGQFLRTPRILSPVDHSKLLDFWNNYPETMY
tara:strand:- start:128 stop:595 length:468 start_codon:yes stop_codon:yes gene_type:complete